MQKISAVLDVLAVQTVECLLLLLFVSFTIGFVVVVVAVAVVIGGTFKMT